MVLPSLPPSLALSLPGDLLMRILLPSQDIAFLEALNEIESWDMALVPYNLPGRDICFEQNLWLGSSHDGKTWLLAAVPHGIDEHFNPTETAVAVLLDPPKQDEDTITEILLRIYIAGREVNELSQR
jgi:hypothetical protein